MFLQFSVSNFKSIQDIATFSMLSSKNNAENTFGLKNYKILDSAVIYGANASGKSNIIKAMGFMTMIIQNRVKVIQSIDKLPYEPFRLNTQSQNMPSAFEIIFFIDDIKYRYGFELDSEKIYSEWLFEDEKGREAKLFSRDIEQKDYVNPKRFKEGERFFNKTNSKIEISQNQLFIWVCDRENNSIISKKILEWFNSFNVIDASRSDSFSQYAVNKMKDDESFKNMIIRLVKAADTGIDGIEAEENDVEIDKIPLELRKIVGEDIVKKGYIKRIDINTIHKKYDENKKYVGDEKFELLKDESVGTQKFFQISAPILDTLLNGKILIVDEIDASLHPILVSYLISLFNNKNKNTKKAQLIFATHDTNLLNSFEREQIWFTQKDKYGATELYSLLEIKNVRDSQNFEKHYIQGKYGAVPFIGDFKFDNE
ncbi:RloA [Campylobacter hyointestinalis]|uniref:AAA family ATPase n=1 Tax=Campylobacter hyointestinalis TaxID=198 RepID=UPI00072C0A9C|nr:ATP-binding protein [Campylobacter hyointestinalis]CUU89182.1 RloA [Campylobacter hyointestinalis]